MHTSSWRARLAMVRIAEALVSIIMSSSKRSSSTRNSASSYWFFRICCRGVGDSNVRAFHATLHHKLAQT
jgi:hypothetical protein